jgi:hypothetical protein
MTSSVKASLLTRFAQMTNTAQTSCLCTVTIGHLNPVVLDGYVPPFFSHHRLHTPSSSDPDCAYCEGSFPLTLAAHISYADRDRKALRAFAQTAQSVSHSIRVVDSITSCIAIA